MKALDIRSRGDHELAEKILAEQQVKRVNEWLEKQEDQGPRGYPSSAPWDFRSSHQGHGGRLTPTRR